MGIKAIDIIRQGQKHGMGLDLEGLTNLINMADDTVTQGTLGRSIQAKRRKLAQAINPDK